MEVNAWMSELDEDRLVRSLVIPASHNSASCVVDFEHTCPAPESTMMTWAQRMPRPLVRGLVQCQDLTITDQLCAGIRGLDLRIARDAHGDFWVVHLMSLIRLDVVVSQIRAFVEQHGSEWIILMAKPSWEHRTLLTEDVMRAELERLLDTFILSPETLLSHARLSDVRGRISLHTERDGFVAHHWANTNRVDELWESIQARLQFRTGLCLETSFVLTPRLGNFSVRRLAQLANAELRARLPELLRLGEGVGLYVSFDFVDRELINLILGADAVARQAK
jgi:hypothetical protein